MAALTKSQVSNAVLDLLRSASQPLHEESIRDGVCELYPRQVTLVMIREALKELATADHVLEVKRAVWTERRRPGSSPLPTESIVAPRQAQAPAPLAPRAGLAIPAGPAPTGDVAAGAVRAVGLSSPGASTRSRNPDKEQDAVIGSPITAKLCVEAGPGYGKTDVACARVAALLASGAAPSALLLLSFTRTAVREMRTRIQTLAKSGVNVAGVEIRTIDSFARELWRAYVGGKRPRSFDEGIDAVNSVLLDRATPAHHLIVEGLQRYRHIFVDEAQDLVGVRTVFVDALLRTSGAGWTVFFDPAQAIYGWSEDYADAAEADARDIVERFEDAGEKFTEHRLATLYRTDNPEIIALQTEARAIVLGTGDNNRVAALRKRLFGQGEADRLTPEALVKLVSGLGESAGSTLLLFRTRAEALEASEVLWKKSLGHRLRLGNLPEVVAPWIALTLNGVDGEQITETQFAAAWKRTVEGTWHSRGWTPEQAWRALARVSQTGARVSVRKIADAVAYRHRLDELFNREIGPPGPILGTIHGSKGREADRVIACLPAAARNREKADEEARVLYVGLTRARKDLFVYAAERPRFSYVDHRPWSGRSGDGFALEIGRAGDLDELAACGVYGTDARAQQQALAKFQGKFVPVWASAKESERDGYIWYLLPNLKNRDLPGAAEEMGLDENLPLGALSASCERAVHEVAKAAGGRNARGYVHQLVWFDLTTAALSGEDTRAQLFQPPLPWRRTRLWLAPVVVSLGFSKTKY